jgi:hypothetical protein
MLYHPHSIHPSIHPLSIHLIAHYVLNETKPNQAERERLRDEGFKDWTRKDLRALVNALEKHGREDKVREGGREGGRWLVVVDDGWVGGWLGGWMMWM